MESLDQMENLFHWKEKLLQDKMYL